MIGTMRIACWQFSRSSSQPSSSTATQGPEAALCSTLNRKPDQLANSRAMDLRIQIYSSFLLFFFSILHFIHSYLPSFPPSLFFAGGAFSFQWGWQERGFLQLRLMISLPTMRKYITYLNVVPCSSFPCLDHASWKQGLLTADGVGDYCVTPLKRAFASFKYHNH